jgi:hypothetical protein
MNGDFADIVTYPPKDYKGIVALQMRNHAEVLNPLLVRLAGYLRFHPSMEHYRGKLLVVEVNRIRIRDQHGPSRCAIGYSILHCDRGFINGELSVSLANG